ncbi:HAD family hydrolase [Ostreiculturibacter nitratireducens]|uniref:sulfotransferase-like domain-containing protein n=1 Tax=Ostreiculturibacter nitratireducens TaxID=3075226 RepID=UPI0031B57A3E
MRIAMWSGPRNLSTAMMYSFAARGDCAVWDEPFYAPYLAATGADHPMRAEIIAAHEADPEKVAARCLGSIPAEKPHFYMKHMPHHMLPGFPLDWAHECENVFLIRHPVRVVASYAKKREGPTLEDIGFVQQAELFNRIAQWIGRAPVVIDSYDIRQDPATMLERLCDAIGLSYTDKMLSWTAGGRPEDGVWASHWYGAVHRSTGFDAPEGTLPDLAPDYARLAEAALPYYEKLAAHRL